MKVNWKYVASTPGYKSLKTAYVKAVMDAQHYQQRFKHKPVRDKAEFLKHFQWVINRAKHYAYHTGKGVVDILTDWESKRDYCWLNYYQECRFPRLDEPVAKRGPLTLKKIRKIAKAGYRDPIDRKAYVFRILVRTQKEQSTKSPARWTMERKKHFKKKSVR